MKRLAAAVVLLLTNFAYAQVACPAFANNGSVASRNWRYTIALADPQHQLLRITMRVEPTSPDLKVQLPVWNATYQVRDFAQHIDWLRASDASGKAVPVRKLDKTTWATPNATTIEYEIAAVNEGPFGAELTTQHAFLNFAQVLIYPFGAMRQRAEVGFANVPEGWKIASPLNSLTDGGFCAANYDQLVDSPVEISDFRETEFTEGGATYRVVVDANPDDYYLKRIAEALQKLVAAETDWMHDRPFTRYTFFYHFPRDLGRGGMEHAYSTAIETSAARAKNDPLAVMSTSAHEFFHLWNVKRIRPQTLEPIDYTKENYTRALWFSEGVTSTVGELSLVRAGFIEEAVFLQRLAQQIRILQTREAHKAQSAEESSLDAWLEKYPYYRAPERSISYYDKGEILGVLLDLEIRRVSSGRKSLRDVFQWMNEHYAKQGKFFDDSDGVREAAEAVTGAKFRNFFAKYVSGLDEIPYDDFFQTVGLKLTRKTITTADAGFTASTNFGPEPIVIAVAPGSEAEKATLRPGDVIQGINGGEPEANVMEQIALLDPGSTLKLKVLSRNRARELKFKLATKEDQNFTFEELPNATPEQRARRAAWERGDNETGAAH